MKYHSLTPRLLHLVGIEITRCLDGEGKHLCKPASLMSIYDSIETLNVAAQGVS